MDKQIREYSKRNNKKRILKRVVSFLCVVVLLFTMNTLKRNANTLERIPMCGLIEHIHGSECFNDAGELVCGMLEHVHTDACYQQSPTAGGTLDDLEINIDGYDNRGDQSDAGDAQSLDLSLDLSQGDLLDFVQDPRNQAPSNNDQQAGNVGLNEDQAPVMANNAASDGQEAVVEFEDDIPSDAQQGADTTGEEEKQPVETEQEQPADIDNIKEETEKTAETETEEAQEQSVETETETETEGEQEQPAETEEDETEAPAAAETEEAQEQPVETETETETEGEQEQPVETEEDETEAPAAAETEEAQEQPAETETEGEQEQPVEAEEDETEAPAATETEEAQEQPVETETETEGEQEQPVETEEDETEAPAATETEEAQEQPAETETEGEQEQPVEAEEDEIEAPAEDEIEEAQEQPVETETETEGEQEQPVEAEEDEIEAPAEDETEAPAEDEIEEAQEQPVETEEDEAQSVEIEIEEEQPVETEGETEETASTEEAPQAEPESQVARPAQHFEEGTAYMNVIVDAPEGAFPEGTVMVVKDVQDEGTLRNIEQSVAGDFVEVTSVHAVDISFWYNDTEIEPLLPIAVVMSAVEGDAKSETPVVVHVADNGETSVVDSESIGATEAALEMPATENPEAQAFEADSFSVYAIVGTQALVKNYIDDSGKTWRIKVGYTESAGLPEGARLEVAEIKNSESYMAEAEAALEEGKRITKARFFDIRIMDTDGNEVQPREAVQVTVTMLGDEGEVEADAKQTDVGAPEVLAMHFVERNDEIVKVVSKNATESGDSVTFTAEGFSPWGVVYTVDFEYNGYQFSMPGDGVLLLSELFSKLHIDEEISEVADVSFTDATLLGIERADGHHSLLEMYLHKKGLSYDVISAIEGGLYAEEENEDSSVEASADINDDVIIDIGDWVLVSLKPFDSEESLTIVMNDGGVYSIRVLDAKQDGEFDITNFLTSATLNINGRDVTDTTWTVEKGEKYSLKLNFQESTWSQFPNTGTMYYKLPEGIKTVVKDTTFSVKINMYGRTYTLPGNTLSVNENGEIRLVWNTSHAMYRYLMYAGNTSINIDIEGMFDETGTVIKFSDSISRTVEIKEPHDVGVTKTASYDKSTGKIHYVVKVTSKGNNTPVAITDTLGSALAIDGNLTITSNKGSVPTYTGGKKNDNTGFNLVFGTDNSGGLSDGEVVTIEYDAKVDYEKIGKSGNATFDETKNVVNVEVPNDDIPENNEASTYESNISFSSFGKDIINMGDVYTETDSAGNAVMYRDLTWKITANEDYSIDLAGSTFKDNNWSQDVMSYKGDYISVTVTDSNNQSETRNIDYESMGDGNHGVSGWKWTVPNEAPYTGKKKFEITYTTKVKIGDGSQSINVNNQAEGKPGTDNEYVPVWSGQATPAPTGSVQPGEPTPTPAPEIIANKAAQVSNKEYTDWKFTINIPADGYTEDFFVVDNLPYWYFNDIAANRYDAYDAETGVKITGLVDGETYTVEPSTTNVKIQFYEGNNDKGLKNTGSARILTISLRTLINQDWFEYAMANGGYYMTHINKGTVNANGLTKDVSAEVEPHEKTIEKVSNGQLTKVQDKDGHQYDAFLYQIRLTNVTTDQIIIDEVFDTTVLKLFPQNKNDGDNVSYQSLQVWGGKQDSWSGTNDQNYTYATVVETASGARIVANVPKKNGVFYDAYFVNYYLYIPDSSKNTLINKAASNGGSVTLRNTAKWDGLPDSVDVEFKYKGVGKTAEDVAGYPDRQKFTITLNPDKATLNGGNPMKMTDTMTNLAIDYATIQVVCDPAANSDVVKYDFSGNTGTFTIPDSTKVVITYEARIVGYSEDDAVEDGSNKNVTVTYSNTAEMYGMTDTHTDTKTFNISGDATSSVLSIQLLKYGEGDMGNPLSGAVFGIYDEDKNPITYASGKTNAGDPITFKTVEADVVVDGTVVTKRGYVRVQLNQSSPDSAEDHGRALEKDKIYYLREITAPSGYAVDPTFYKFVIGDIADYNNYIYIDNDILKVRDYPKQNELELRKYVVGPALTAEQESEISFVVQSVNENNVPNGTYVRTISLANFDKTTTQDGKVLYSVKLEDLPEGKYRVYENGDNVTDLVLTNSEFLMNEMDAETQAQVAGGTLGSYDAESKIVMFTINSENKLAQVGYENTYSVRHTYYFSKVEQGNTDIKVPGAVFTVFNANGTSTGYTYTTDQNGKFSIYKEDGHAYAEGVLYYVQETQSPADYVAVDETAPKYYFYFGGTPSIPSDVTAVNLGEVSKRQTVENTIKTVDIPVEKTWVGVTNLPESVTVKLYRRLVDSGDEWELTNQTLVLTPDENDDTKDWKGSFENLDKDYEYKVEEVIPEGVYYAATYANNDGVKEQSADKTIEIINTTTLKNITVHKIWVDEPADDPNYQRPTAYFTLQVKKPDEGEWVNADNNGFAALYDGTWNNTEFNAIVKDKIDLYRSITSENASCEWTNLPGRFIYRVVETDSNHNAYAEGQKIDEGKYVVTYDNGYMEGISFLNGESEGETVITNTYSMTYLDVKKIWNTTQQNTPDIYVKLYRNPVAGEVATYPADNPKWIGVPNGQYDSNIRSLQLKADNGYAGRFLNIEKGYVYHIVEDEISGYITTVSDGNIFYGGETAVITNSSYTTDDKSIAVKKQWYDENGLSIDTNIPSNVVVELKRVKGTYDGHQVKVTFNHSGNYDLGSKTIIMKNGTSATFTINAGDYGQWNDGVQVFNGSIEGETVTKGNATVSLVISSQNTAHQIPISVTVSNVTADCEIKVNLTPQNNAWLDGNGIKASDYTVAPFMPTTAAQSISDGMIDGKATTQELNATNNWYYKWTNLPADDGNGTAYLYIVEETSVLDNSGKDVTDDYTVTYDDGNNGDGVQTGVIYIKNTKKPPKTEFRVLKKWMSNGTQWNPEYNGGTIKFRLYKTDGATRVQVNAEGEQIWAGNETLQYSDVVYLDATTLGLSGSSTDAAVLNALIAANKLATRTEDGETYYAIPYMKSYTLPELPAGWSYTAVELDGSGKELKLDDAHDGSGQYWNCAEFGGLALKNDLTDVTAVKTWNDKGNTVTHPAVTFKLYRTTQTVNTDAWSNETGYDSQGISWGTAIAERTIPAGSADLTVTWPDQPKYDLSTGKCYTYYVQEESVPGYRLKTRGRVGGNLYQFSFENELETIDFIFNKQWLEGSSPLAQWPEGSTITVRFTRYLKAGTDTVTETTNAFEKTFTLNKGGEVGTASGLTITASGENPVAYTISNLEKYGSIGDKYGEWVYQVEETSCTPSDYTVSYSGGSSASHAENGETISNTHWGVALPSTGGVGTGVVYGAGAALMLLALLGLVLMNRKRSRGTGI